MLPTNSSYLTNHLSSETRGAGRRSSAIPMAEDIAAAACHLEEKKGVWLSPAEKRISQRSYP